MYAPGRSLLLLCILQREEGRARSETLAVSADNNSCQGFMCLEREDMPLSIKNQFQASRCKTVREIIIISPQYTTNLTLGLSL